MKVLMTLALASCSLVAMAAETEKNYDQLPLEHYTYSTDLDIARVIRTSAVPNECRVVPVEMVYEDHQGNAHRLEYLVMGNGCDN